MQDRLEKAIEYCRRVFIHSDFKDSKKLKEIIKELEVNTEVSSKKTFFEEIPCYKAPLLTFEQEQHLFRKMNYFKYKAKILLEKNNISNLRLEKAEELIVKAKKVRNTIAESNLRLATQLLKCNISYYRQNSLIDSLLSDAYFDVLKSVDYFDWTLGNRFSTYATWVVKKNFFRDSKERQKKAKKSMRLEDTDTSFCVDKSESFLAKELEQESQKKLVFELLNMLEKGDCSSDQKRQVFILESYFGLNGKKNCTLEQISKDLGVTKERVRQLKEKGLDWIRSKTNQMDLI